MKKKIFVGILAAGLTAAAFTIPAEARCEGESRCAKFESKPVRQASRAQKTRTATTVRSTKQRSTRQRSARASTGKVRRLAHKSTSSSAAMSATMSAATAVPARQTGSVQAMIERMAPAHGVPVWFALRIAKVESNYNPNARGQAGELGVFQMKCATARGIGYRGDCSGLLNASTGIEYGLKHLSLAIKSSGGNLQLAASKHNGGLGRKRLVPKYVAAVF